MLYKTCLSTIFMLSCSLALQASDSNAVTLQHVKSGDLQEEKKTSIGSLQKSVASKVILVAGPSSSGKTSTINELKKIYGKSHQVVKMDGDFDFDAVREKQAIELGWNPEKATFNDFMAEYVLKQTGKATSLLGIGEFCTDPIMLKEMRDKRLRAFFQHIHDVAIKSENVIVDTVFVYADDYEMFFDVMHDQRIAKILIYLPLEAIAQRVETRNNSGDKRSVFQAINQFPAFYKVKESDTEPIVDVIRSNSTKQFLKKILDDDYRRSMQDADYYAMVRYGLSQHDISELKIEFYAFYRAFVERFKLETSKTVVLVPQREWDLVVNTSIHSPEEAAQIIVEYLKKKEG